MEITANMKTQEGIAITDSYVRVTQACVKKMTRDDEGTTGWKRVYDGLSDKDKDTRDDELKEKTMRIKNNHVDHFKIDYS